MKDRLLVSITGRTEADWKSKLKEIEKYKIHRISLFLECFDEKQRKAIYQALLNSSVKEIPLVHIKNDMEREELAFLVKEFKTKYLTIHECSFAFLKKWKGFHKSLYLEMNADNFISQSVKVNRIGGFCIDLSHFKIKLEKCSKELMYILKRKEIRRYFACNHLNGYSYQKNEDLHTVNSLKDFDYLKTLPKFVFGKVISLETFNSIKDQLKFKKYLSKLL